MTARPAAFLNNDTFAASVELLSDIGIEKIAALRRTWCSGYWLEWIAAATR